MRRNLLDISSKSQGPIRQKPDAAKILRFPHMVATPQELEFNEALCARTHRLRNERGWTSEQMATALGIPAERYRKYEYRSPMPAYLMERFALIVGCDIPYLLIGRGQRVTTPPQNKEKRRA